MSPSLSLTHGTQLRRPAPRCVQYEDEFEDYDDDDFEEEDEEAAAAANPSKPPRASVADIMNYEDDVMRAIRLENEKATAEKAKTAWMNESAPLAASSSQATIITGSHSHTLNTPPTPHDSVAPAPRRPSPVSTPTPPPRRGRPASRRTRRRRRRSRAWTPGT